MAAPDHGPGNACLTACVSVNSGADIISILDHW